MDPDTARLRAEFHDAQYADADREDLEYYVDLATASEEPTLEVGCGTGRIYLELLQAGVDADGLDLSEAALDVLRAKAADLGVDPTVRRADMTDFSAERAYELVVCPFNGFLNLTALEDQRAALEAVHDALAPGGRFVFDVFVPDFEYIAEAYGAWQSRTVPFRGDRYEYRTRAEIVDEIDQVYRVEREAVGPDGELLFADEQRLKLLPYRELRLLVESSPFESYRVTGDYTDDPISDGDTVQVWTLRPGSQPDSSPA